MNAKDVLRQSLAMNERMLDRYLGDLDDADLLVRPVEGMNHIAWQLGHLISTERWIAESIRPGSSPALPEGFDEAHARDATASDDPSKFLSKDLYLDLFRAQRAATLAVLDALSDEELDAPGPERSRALCPTVGSLLGLAGTHVIMHAGQFVPVRRLRGKPIAI